MTSDIGAAIAAAARTMNQRQTLPETLQTIAEIARDAIPGINHAGISTVDQRGRVETKAATSDLVWTLDRLQYSLGEGPCVDTLRNGPVVRAPHIRHDQRWPRFVPRAVEEGLRSQLAVRLYLDHEGLLGGLNLYSTESDDIDPDAEGIADLFAAHAAIALGSSTHREQLNQALQSRKVIGQAIGMLMERYQVNEDRAFAYLVRTSSHGNIKLSVIASQMVEVANKR